MSELFYIEILKKVCKNLEKTPGRFLYFDLDEADHSARLNVGYTKTIDLETVEDCIAVYYDEVGEEGDFYAIYFSDPNFFDSMQKLLIELIGEKLTWVEQSIALNKMANYLSKKCAENIIKSISATDENVLVFKDLSSRKIFKILFGENHMLLCPTQGLPGMGIKKFSYKNRQFKSNIYKAIKNAL